MYKKDVDSLQWIHAQTFHIEVKYCAYKQQKTQTTVAALTTCNAVNPAVPPSDKTIFHIKHDFKNETEHGFVLQK